jgi:hypothetical protein
MYFSPIPYIKLFIDFKKDYDSVMREVLYNIFIESGVPIKLVVRLIKICLKETYIKFRIGKHLSDKFSYPEWSKKRRCFIATAF